MRAALASARYVAERRAGRQDAVESTQGAEEAIVSTRGRLDAARSLLRVRLALGAPEEPTAALLQAFRDRLLAADIAADLAEVHRHLLTLYPAVEAELVEATRVSVAEADRAAGATEFDAVAHALGDRLDRLSESLDSAL